MNERIVIYLKDHFRDYRFYKLAQRIRNALRGSDRYKVISLKPERQSAGNVLLSYIHEPLLLKPGEPISTAHTHDWESVQIARTFSEWGYSVDVIGWTNDRFIPKKPYSFFIDARMNLERLSPLLNRDCVKVMHIETAHWLFHMTAQHHRLLALQKRKGVTLRPWKTVDPNCGIEHADCATILGNEFTISTYLYAKKPLYRVPISTPVLYSWPEAKDFDRCRKRFLWFGSGGLVHKGLDLVLEAFATMPDYHLTVCGPIAEEKDFERAYYQELYQRPNIETVGWVDVASQNFIDIANSCIGLIYPSCSEGQCGGVVTCLHAGLIPIISYESGVDVDDFGFILPDCSIENIKESIRTVGDLPSRELEERARKAWEFARANHTREKFAEAYRKIVGKIIAGRDEFH